MRDIAGDLRFDQQFVNARVVTVLVGHAVLLELNRY